MKKLKISAAVMAAALTAICFSGCALYGNDRSRTAYIEAKETDTDYVYDISSFSYVNENLYINKITGEARIEEGSVKQTADDNIHDAVVLCGNDFPRYSSFCADGYESLSSILIERYENGEVEYIQYYAVEYGGTAYGFCNLYSSATGFLSGGGQIDAAKIVCGVHFKYDAAADEFSEIGRFEKCVIVAVSEQSLIYFKNRKYYAHTEDGEEKYICDDEAYDTGMTHYSYAEFCFNAEHCIIIMKRRYNNDKKDYTKIILTDYSGNVLVHETLKNNR